MPWWVPVGARLGLSRSPGTSSGPRAPRARPAPLAANSWRRSAVAARINLPKLFQVSFLRRLKGTRVSVSVQHVAPSGLTTVVLKVCPADPPAARHTLGGPGRRRRLPQPHGGFRGACPRSLPRTERPRGLSDGRCAHGSRCEAPAAFPDARH